MNCREIFPKTGSALATRFKRDSAMRRAEFHARRCPESATQSIATLALYLTDPFTSDLDKAWGIFCWITTNISYDYESLKPGRRRPQDAATALATRLTVCQGFSELFVALARMAGLYAQVISGLSVSLDHEPDFHAWCAVEIDGWWSLCDVTYAVCSNQVFRAAYFRSPPGQMIRTHFPWDPVWQLLKNPISFEEFQTLSGLKQRSADSMRRAGRLSRWFN